MVSIKWYGHSCFRVTDGINSIVLDPYNNSAGYPELHVSGGLTLCSHEHGDHNYVQAVSKEPWDESQPIPYHAIETFHDDVGGKQRGKNLMNVIVCGGFKIVHCGDLGHDLDEKTLSKIRDCDVLMIPVGGYFTIDAKTAAKITNAVSPRVCIPMHYKMEGLGLSAISGVQPFLDEIRLSYMIYEQPSNELNITKDMPRGVYVMKYEK